MRNLRDASISDESNCFERAFGPAFFCIKKDEDLVLLSSVANKNEKNRPDRRHELGKHDRLLPTP